MSPTPVEHINVALRDHQSFAATWGLRVAAADLHQWAERLILEFKLQIGVPALLIQPLRKRYGHFRVSRNGFGLIDEVGIDEAHLRNDPFWEVCWTLLHELIHCWQVYFGIPGSGNSHNEQFRDKARECGLLIDEHGFTQCRPGETAFPQLLKRHGIEVPALPPPSKIPAGPRVGSKLRLWECPCGVKVRVGRSYFNAQCLDCGGKFVLQGSPLNLGTGTGNGLPPTTKVFPQFPEDQERREITIAGVVAWKLTVPADDPSASSRAIASNRPIQPSL